MVGRERVEDPAAQLAQQSLHVRLGLDFAAAKIQLSLGVTKRVNPVTNADLPQISSPSFSPRWIRSRRATRPGSVDRGWVRGRQQA